MKFLKAILLMAVVFLAGLDVGSGHALIAAIFLTVMFVALSTPRSRLCLGPTLSVPEILMDVMEAFKLQTPALSMFSTDFSSKTAVLGDKITAHIDLLPVSATYDPTPGKGFYNGNQDVTAIIADVPVTMNQFIHVPIKIGWLTQLSSKLPLYQRAIRNIGFVLGKAVVDQLLATVAANFSNTSVITLANSTLDTMEFMRTQLNTQKAQGSGRFGICSSAFAQALQNDDRVKSSLFYGALNGDQGYRVFKNMSGFETVLEYPDFTKAGANLSGIFGDRRSMVVASRRPDFSNVAAELGVPQVMEFYPMEDPESGFFMTGVAWQEVGTGDVYVSAAGLFGVASGNQGGVAGTITDNAGYLLKNA